MALILFWAVNVLFALLCMYAAAVQLSNPRHKTPCLLMILGGFVLLCAVAACRDGRPWDWMVALAGFAAICVAALWNGQRDGIINPKHHIVRVILCAALVTGFLYL